MKESLVYCNNIIFNFCLDSESLILDWTSLLVLQITRALSIFDLRIQLNKETQKKEEEKDSLKFFFLWRVQRTGKALFICIENKEDKKKEMDE